MPARARHNRQISSGILLMSSSMSSYRCNLNQECWEVFVDYAPSAPPPAIPSNPKIPPNRHFFHKLQPPISDKRCNRELRIPHTPLPLTSKPGFDARRYGESLVTSLFCPRTRRCTLSGKPSSHYSSRSPSLQPPRPKTVFLGFRICHKRAAWPSNNNGSCSFTSGAITALPAKI